MAKRKRRHRRSVDVRINWLQPHAEGFKDWLDDRNYSPATIIEVVRLLALWADWVRAKGFELETLDAGLAASASVFRGSKKARAPQGAAKLFITYLRNEGVLPPAHEPSLEENWPELAAFRHWMREQRGIMDSTLDTYQQTLTDLLAALGTDPAAYTATAIRDFVLERAKPHGIGRARASPLRHAPTSNTSWRSDTARSDGSMRFRPSQAGNWRRCPASSGKPISIACSPRVRTRSDYVTARSSSCLPAGVESERSRQSHLRRLRLEERSAEAVRQEPPGGTPAAHTGGWRRHSGLYQAGTAPNCDDAHVPDRNSADQTRRPYRGEMPVRRALDRAKIDSAHRGAHMLRHSAATAMLRNGASLAGVGTVLRHRSPSVTALYAKVDIGLLSEIAQPRGGRLPC